MYVLVRWIERNRNRDPSDLRTVTRWRDQFRSVDETKQARNRRAQPTAAARQAETETNKQRHQVRDRQCVGNKQINNGSEKTYVR